MTIMISNDDKRLPVATANQSRLMIFQATRRPKMLEEFFITKHGKIRVKGRIGQQHADTIEAIFMTAERATKMEDGRIKLLVDPAKVRRAIGEKASGEALKKITDDLMQTLIEIIDPPDLSCIGHLIDHIDKAVKSDGTPITRLNPLNGGERPMWRVKIGEAACKLIDKDILLYRDLKPIIALKYGISQAAARYILSHKQQPNGGWKIDTVIKAVAGNISDSEIWNRRRELKKDKDNFKGIGVEIIDDKFCISQTRIE